MHKRIKVTSKTLPKVSPDDIAKALGAERCSPLEALADNTHDVPLGEPIVYVQTTMFISFEHGLLYTVGQFASHRNVKREDISGYRLLSGKAADEIYAGVGCAQGFCIQFYTPEHRVKDVLATYRESPRRIYKC
ncbi:hypothetical protein HY639_03955 [Candidatus Woesearchaeota archaeon]|nr:hypothetical protein [Candidatus Woesearchaeota archaeon]